MFPKTWVHSERSNDVQIIDNSVVQFWNKEESFGWIRTKNPIPMESPRYHFEIMLLHSNDDQFIIDLGLTSKGLSSDLKIGINNVTEMCKDGSGFRNFPYSFGYTSRGIIYGTDIKEACNERLKYSIGDLVGCYVDMENEVCCFTKNGVAQNPIIHLSNMDEPLFPTILFSSNGAIINSYFDESKFELESQGIY